MKKRAVGAHIARKLVPQARVDGYVVGRTGPQPVWTGLGIGVACLLVMAVVFSLTGVLFVPGALAIYAVGYYVCPPRSLAVCDQGLALMDRSFWTGKPTKVVALLTHRAVTKVVKDGNRYRLELGPEHLWLSTQEELLFRQFMMPYVYTAGGPNPMKAPAPNSNVGTFAQPHQL
jgi:hypothetical protein